MLTSLWLLLHYEVSKPLILVCGHCDASPYGLEAVLSHHVGEDNYPFVLSYVL